MIGCFYDHGRWVALHLQRHPETGDTLVVARLGECPGDADGHDVPLACRPTAGAALDRALHGSETAGATPPTSRRRRPPARGRRSPTLSRCTSTRASTAAARAPRRAPSSPTRRPPTGAGSASSATPPPAEPPAGPPSRPTDHPTTHTPGGRPCPSAPTRSPTPRTRRRSTAVELDDFGHSFRPVAPGLFTCPIDVARLDAGSTTATSCARSCARAASARQPAMSLLRHARSSTPATPEPTERAERSHTLVPWSRRWPANGRATSAAACSGCPRGCAGRRRCSTPTIHARSSARTPGARAAALAAPPAQPRAPDRRLPPAPQAPRATPRARRALDPAHECAACRGAGEIGFNPGYPDPQRADSMPCADCRGTRCRARAVTGARDAVTPATTRGTATGARPRQRPRLRATSWRASSCSGCTTCPATSTPSSAAIGADPPNHPPGRPARAGRHHSIRKEPAMAPMTLSARPHDSTTTTRGSSPTPSSSASPTPTSQRTSWPGGWNARRRQRPEPRSPRPGCCDANCHERPASRRRLGPTTADAAPAAGDWGRPLGSFGI